MRKYAVLYNSRACTWSVIFKDLHDNEWYVDASDLREEDARAMVRGYQQEG